MAFRYREMGSRAGLSEIWHFLHVEYWGQPWYQGQVYGNVFVIPIVFVLGVLLWPPLRRALVRFVRGETAELHRKLDHVILHHPDIPPQPPKKP